MFLELDNVCAGYGQIEVLHGVSLHVNQGEIVSILGTNGAGKTTTMHTISGLATFMRGSITKKYTSQHKNAHKTRSR
jgi:ABC-type branched-subunit amino acid transport system ATPase component